jgi:hypothetical protein
MPYICIDSRPLFSPFSLPVRGEYGLEKVQNASLTIAPIW